MTLLRACLALALALCWVAVPNAVRAQAAYVLVLLHSFSAMDGSYPGNLIEGHDGNLYGVTIEGGGAKSYNTGTVFQLTPGGALHTLDVCTPITSTRGGNDGGASPDGLIQAADGNFYGVAQVGGKEGGGTAFRLTAAGVPSVIYQFPGVDAMGINTVGSRPVTLTVGHDGNLYGTTYQGGTKGGGIVFRLTTDGTLTVLANLPGPPPVITPSSGQSVDKSSHFSSVTPGRDGNLYGVISYGGAYAQGMVFSITPAGVMTILYAFSATDADGTNFDGAAPTGGLTEGVDGRLYGTTYQGGVHGEGTVYAITPDGVLTTVYDFGDNALGVGPAGNLILDTDGNLCGVTLYGGPAGRGTVFSLTPDGSITVLYRVILGDSIAGPIELFQSRERNFYVIDRSLADDGYGAIYALEPASAIRPVASLAAIRPKAIVDRSASAAVKVSLSTPSPRNVVVRYTVGGSAVNGTDDDALGGTVGIKAGQMDTVIYVTPRGDLGGDALRTVRLTLLAGERYVVGASATAKVKLLPTYPP